MKYKIGDRVKIVDNKGTNARVGDVGTIAAYDFLCFNSYALNFDRYDDVFHNCSGKVPKGHGQWVYGYNLSLLEEDEPSKEFKLVIISKGDKTKAKLYRGESFEKEVEVNRYHADEYSEKAAIKAVVNKMFPCDPFDNEKYLTAKVVCTESYGLNFKKGNMYEVINGYLNGDIGMFSGIENEKDLNEIGGYKFIILNEN